MENGQAPGESGSARRGMAAAHQEVDVDLRK